jgi:hypothetical protein
MNDKILSLILTVSFFLLGLLFLYIGFIVVGTYMSQLMLTYIAAFFFILSFLLFATFLHNLLHKEFKVRHVPNPETLINKLKKELE